MIKAPSTIRLLLPWLFLGLAAAQARADEEPAAFAQAGRLLQYRCAMPGCHAGPNASAGMRMEADQIYRSTVNIHARTDGRFLRVQPGAPDQSLVYLKLLTPQSGHYIGPRMPLSMDPLKPEEIAVIKQWIESFPSDLWGHAPPAAEVAERLDRTFRDAYLADLPTSDPLGKGTLEFVFGHRFRSSVKDAGTEGLWGLDSGANISLDLMYGVSRNVDVGMRRTNLDTDYEWYSKVGILHQARGGSPVSLALRGSVSDVRETGRVNRERLAAQVILARRLRERVSVMLVPSYVTRTDDLDPNDKGGTAAVGAGLEWHLTPKYALTGEWVAQTGGLKAAFQSGSVGFSMATARHVFQLLVTNTPGTHTDQYVPGGDLDFRKGEYRLGFNISRTHAYQ